LIEFNASNQRENAKPPARAKADADGRYDLNWISFSGLAHLFTHPVSFEPNRTGGGAAGMGGRKLELFGGGFHARTADFEPYPSHEGLFGRLIGLARAEPVAVVKVARLAVVLTAPAAQTPTTAGSR
jgi:hypothetical protein